MNTSLTENEHVLKSCSTESQLLREEKKREEESISHVRFLINEYPTKFEQMRMKLRGVDEKEFFPFLNAKCELEDIPMEFKKINARFNLLLSNWSKTKETPHSVNLSKM